MSGAPILNQTGCQTESPAAETKTHFPRNDRFALLTFPTAGRRQRDVLHLEEGLHLVAVVLGGFGGSLRPVHVDGLRGHFTKAHHNQNKTGELNPGMHRAGAFNS